MIYYPLDTLKNMGIVDIMVIVFDKLQEQLFKNQLGNGSKFGLNLCYKIQESPKGLPEAFIIAEDFIGDDDVSLILGDNILVSNYKIPKLTNSIFTYKVKNPSSYGVAEVTDGKLINLVEKPENFLSDQAVIGLYIFDNRAVEIAKKLKPSNRKELEIVDLIKEINKIDSVKVNEFEGFWFDCGTHEDLIECSNLIRTIEDRTNKIIGLYE
jgi:glucose-1-phosphate thymidylyltransferase